MGDEASQHGRPPIGNFTNLTPLQTLVSNTTADLSGSGYARGGRTPNESNYPSASQQEMDVQRFPSVQASTMGSFAPGHASRTSPLNMSGMAGALPDYQSSSLPFSQQIPHSIAQGPTTPALLYSFQQGSQFAGQTPGQSPHYGALYQNYPNVYQTHQGYQHVLPSPQQQSAGPASGQSQQSFVNQQFFPQHPQQQYAPQFPQQQSMQPRGHPYHQPYVRRSSGNSGQGPLREQELRGLGAMYGVQDQGTSGAYLQPEPSGHGVSGKGLENSSTGPSIPRGPPRKPKQSGHALWVGNLPPGTNVVDLKEHFSKDATKDIESVFLISKSNCAFVNYRTETSCAAAMARFHDSRFQGVRLVCRLRRGSTAPTSGAPTGPSASNPAYTEEPTSPVIDKKATVESDPEQNEEVQEEEEEKEEEEGAAPKTREKFFIVKSLTVDDLEMSVRNGIWATQAHNEAALNKAYKTSENVYLIFSANKSGEYFGYARMISSINEDSAASLEWTPKATATPIPSREPDLPTTIPTPATEVAPKGRIIDDSARGTIFWEADLLDSAEKSGDDSKGEESPEDVDEVAAGNQSFGKPFKIEWISTERVPFFRTRGLRNPWNANREVKIARDGTMIEPGVGRRLIQMFHRPLPPGGRPTPPSMQIGFPPQLPRNF